MDYLYSEVRRQNILDVHHRNKEEMKKRKMRAYAHTHNISTNINLLQELKNAENK